MSSVYYTAKAWRIQVIRVRFWDGLFWKILLYARTHGETYEEALENAREVLEDLVYGYEQTGKPLPVAQTLQVA